MDEEQYARIDAGLVAASGVVVAKKLPVREMPPVALPSLSKVAARKRVRAAACSAATTVPTALKGVDLAAAALAYSANKKSTAYPARIPGRRRHPQSSGASRQEGRELPQLPALPSADREPLRSVHDERSAPSNRDCQSFEGLPGARQRRDRPETRTSPRPTSASFRSSCQRTSPRRSTLLIHCAGPNRRGRFFENPTWWIPERKG